MTELNRFLFFLIGQKQTFKQLLWDGKQRDLDSFQDIFLIEPLASKIIANVYLMVLNSAVERVKTFAQRYPFKVITVNLLNDYLFKIFITRFIVFMAWGQRSGRQRFLINIRQTPEPKPPPVFPGATHNPSKVNLNVTLVNQIGAFILIMSPISFGHILQYNHEMWNLYSSSYTHAVFFLSMFWYIWYFDIVLILLKKQLEFIFSHGT